MTVIGWSFTGSLECDSESAVHRERVRRTQESVVAPRTVRDTADRNSRGTDAGGVAKDTVGRILLIEEVVDIAEYFEPARNLEGRVQTEHLVARHRRVLIGLVPIIVRVTGKLHRRTDSPVRQDLVIDACLDPGQRDARRG